jgi:hypothetical protein
MNDVLNVVKYALKTKDLFIKGHVLDSLTVCIREANDSEEDLVSRIKSRPEDMTTENLTYRFLLNFERNRPRNFFFETLKSDTTKANLIREYDKLITAYEGIFPITKELEEIHEKKIDLLELNSQFFKAFLKGREEASNWLKSHSGSGFLKEFKKNYRELKKLYVIKQIDLNELWKYDQSEKKKMIANFIWNEIFGEGLSCPEDILRYWMRTF